jgi:hypothetical protein
VARQGGKPQEKINDGGTMRGNTGRLIGVAMVAARLLARSASAQQKPAGGGEERDLAKELSNPIASLVSLPFQFNWEQNVGPSELTRFVLNVQRSCPS